MIINALNSGAKVFMADFEDSTTPTWENVLDGQLNLRDAVRRTITYDDPATGKHYELKPDPAVLFVRARGWHLEERHILVDGEPMSGSIFDFALYFFHNAKELLARGSGPYFYLPKMESHLEARLWNSIFVRAQELLGVPQGSIRATVLIETILASFEMDEILYELRDHSAGLNCGRWDYIFSFIKKLAGDQTMLLPDRGQVTMTTHFMRSLLAALHQDLPPPQHLRDGRHERAHPHQVRPRREREGHRRRPRRQGARGHRRPRRHLGRASRPRPHRARSLRPHHAAAEPDLEATARLHTAPPPTCSPVPTGTITFAGLKQNVAVGLGYLEAWLRGIGCVPLFNLMEDAATAEISRAQLWQWVHHHAVLEDGRPVTAELCDETIDAELARAKSSVDAARFAAYEQAACLMHDLIAAPHFPDFLTLPAYDRVLEHEVYTA